MPLNSTKISSFCRANTKTAQLSQKACCYSINGPGLGQSSKPNPSHTTCWGHSDIHFHEFPNGPRSRFSALGWRRQINAWGLSVAAHKKEAAPVYKTVWVSGFGYGKGETQRSGPQTGVVTASSAIRHQNRRNCCPDQQPSFPQPNKMAWSAVNPCPTTHMSLYATEQVAWIKSVFSISDVALKEGV